MLITYVNNKEVIFGLVSLFYIGIKALLLASVNLKHSSQVIDTKLVNNKSSRLLCYFCSGIFNKVSLIS